MSRWLAIGLIGLCWFAAPAFSTPQCSVCDRYIALGEKYTRVQIKASGEQRDLCVQCRDLPPCFACGLPSRKQDGHKFADGRHLCHRDAPKAVLNESDALDICRETQRDLARQFYRFLSLPEKNVTVEIVDRPALEYRFGNPGNDHFCGSVLGLTVTHQRTMGTNTSFSHRISILSGLSKPRLVAVAAHEFTHTWISENIPADRRAKLAKETVEGFCELVAYKLVEEINGEEEKKSILANNYTKDQIGAFIQADAEYGFYHLMQWVRFGVDNKLDPANLQRVRFLEPGPARPAGTPPVYAVPQSIPPAPETLTLKGISGSGNRRFALINNQTFSVSETARVRMGTNVLNVTCLEIQDQSVIIEADGIRQELLLKAAGKN